MRLIKRLDVVFQFFDLLANPRYLWRVIPIAALVVGYIQSAHSSAYSVAFYGTAAQVIPVILLVLAVELRVFEPPHKWTKSDRPKSKTWEDERAELQAEEWKGPLWVPQLLVLVALIASEIVALVAVGTERPSGPVSARASSWEQSRPA